MNKKTYIQPSMKVISVKDSIIATSGPSSLSITDDYVDEEPQGGVSPQIWGKQW